MQSLKEYTKDLFQYIPSAIIPALVSLISVPLFTRYLSPDAWGNYVLVLNATELLTTISVSWLSSSIVRFYEQSLQDNKTSRFISTVIVSGLLSVFSFIGLAFTFLFAIKKKLPEDFLLVAISIGLWLFAIKAIGNLLQSIFKAKRKVSLYSGLASWQSISGFGFGFIFVGLLGWGFEGLLFGSALGLTIGVILFSFALRDQLFRIKATSLRLVKSMFMYGFPIVAGDISYWFLRLADRYILTLFRGTYEVGIYSVGYDLSDKALGLLISLLAISSWPLTIQIWERKGEQATSAFLTQLMRLFLLLCVPAVIAVSLLREPLMSVMTDELYFEGNRIVPLIMLSVFFFGFQRWFQVVPALYKKTRFIAIAILSGAVLSIVLNFIFTPSFGYHASAIINVISYAFVTLLMIFFSRSLLVWKFPFDSLAKSLISSAFMAAGIVGIISIHMPDWLKLVVSIPFGAVLYLIALVVFKELSYTSIKTFVRPFFQKPT